MANGKVYKIDFKLAADMTANYRTTMQHVERDFQNVERQFRTIEALRMSGSMVNPLSQKLGSLKNELKEIKNVNGPTDFFQKIIHELQTVLPDLREVKRLMTDISRIQQPNQRFGSDAEQYVRHLREMEQRMRAIRQQAGPSSAGSGGNAGSESSEGGGSGVGGLLVAGGTAAMAGVAAVGAAGFFALKGANDYQKAMNQIQASTLASDKDMQSLKQAAKGVYTSGLGEGWEEISQVLSKTRQVTGQVGKELENTTKNAIALQNTYENLDIESSLKAAQTATRNFKATSTQAYNLFAQGAAKGLDYSGELLDTSNEYSVYFKKLGFDMNQMFDVFAAGMENGAFNLDKVGDSVKEFGIRSKDGSKTSADAYKLLGLNAKKMTAEFAKGGPAAQKAWEQVGKALKDMKDPVKQNAAAVGLFGTQAEDMEIGVILALTNARKQFDMTKNTMEQVQKIKYNDIGTAFKMIGRQLNAALIIPLAEAMLPALSAFSNWFNDVTPKAKGFISTFGAGITKGAGDIAYLFQNGFDGEMQGVAFNIGKYFGLSDADSSQMVEGIKDMITAAMDEFSKLQTAVAPTINAIKGFLMPLATFGKSTFVTLGTAIMGAANIVKNYLAPTFTMVFGYITSTLLPLVITTFQGWLPKISNLISTLVPLFMAIYQRGIVPLIAAFQYAWPLISTIISNAVSVIGPIIGGVIDILSGLVTFLTGVFTGNWAQAWEGLKQIAIGIWDGITGAIVAAFNGVINVINVAIDKINGFKFDLPDWAGGGSFGGLGIEHIPTFADGGIATQPSIFGEAGPEMAIPLNNKQRSMDLLAKTNQMMGYEQSGSGDNLNLSFNITIQGNADKEVVQQAVQATQPQFRQQYNQMKRQNARVSLS